MSFAEARAIQVLNHGPRKATIGLDFDDTYTTDPTLWEKFIQAAQKRGHKVVIVTARPAEDEKFVKSRIKAGVPVVFSALKAKKPVTASFGHNIDIWIDDRPKGINEDHPHRRPYHGEPKLAGTPAENLASLHANVSRRAFLRGAVGTGLGLAATLPPAVKYLADTHFENKAIQQEQEHSAFQKAMRQRLATPTPTPKIGAHTDQIPGGLADKKKPADFPSGALRKGIRVELEHTNRRSVAREIAMDHLTEDKRYYDKLEKIEKHAAPRWARELATHVDAGKPVTPEWTRALTSVPRERQVMPLGEGMEGIADLMAGPRGLNVRKLYYDSPWTELLGDKQRLLPGARAVGLVPQGMGDITASPSGQRPMQRMPYLPGKAQPGDVETLNDLADRSGLPAADIRSRNVRRDASGVPYVFDPLVTGEATAPEVEQRFQTAGAAAAEHAAVDPAGYASRFNPDMVRRRAYVTNPAEPAYVPPSSAPPFAHTMAARVPATAPARASASAVAPKPLHEIAAEMWTKKASFDPRRIEQAWLAGDKKKLRAIAERIKQKKGPVKFVAFAGRGSEGIADVVTHPQHGLAIRKVYDPLSVQHDAVHAWNRALPDAIRNGVVHPGTEQAKPTGEHHVMVSYAPLLDTAMSHEHPMGDDKVLRRIAKTVAHHARKSGLDVRDIHAGNVGTDPDTGKAYAFDFLPKGYHPPKPDYRDARHRLSLHLRYTERGQQLLRDMATGKHVSPSRLHAIEADAKAHVDDLKHLKAYEASDLKREMRKLAEHIEKTYPPKRILGLTFKPDVRRVFHGPGFGHIQCGHIPGTSNPADGGAVDVFSFTIGRKGKITNVLALSRKNTGNDKYLVEIDGIAAPKDWEKRWKANAEYACLLDAGKVKGREGNYHKDNYATGETFRVVGGQVAARMSAEKRASVNLTDILTKYVPAGLLLGVGGLTAYDKLRGANGERALTAFEDALKSAPSSPAKGVVSKETERLGDKLSGGTVRVITDKAGVAAMVNDIRAVMTKAGTPAEVKARVARRLRDIAIEAINDPSKAFIKVVPGAPDSDKPISYAAIVTTPNNAPEVIKHEMGHAAELAAGRTFGQPLTVMDNLIYSGFYKKVVEPEELAWGHTDVPAEHPLRVHALKTYAESFHANRPAVAVPIAAGLAALSAATGMAIETITKTSAATNWWEGGAPVTASEFVTSVGNRIDRDSLITKIANSTDVMAPEFVVRCRELTSKYALDEMTKDELSRIMVSIRS